MNSFVSFNTYKSFAALQSKDVRNHTEVASSDSRSYVATGRRQIRALTPVDGKDVFATVCHESNFHLCVFVATLNT